MTGIPGTCSKTLTEECAREATLRAATAALTDPSALLALRVFDAFFSQWRTGLSPVGLDYPAVIEYSQRFLGIEVDDEVFACLQVLEAEQLDAWRPAKKEGGTK
jgi:hypothetical protein